MFDFIPQKGLTLAIGKPGAGKTSWASAMVSYANKNNIRVFSNVPILGAEIFKPKEYLGQYDLSHSMIIIDEANAEFSGRRWTSNINDDMLDYIVRFRHAHIDYFIFLSQWINMDKTFRDMANTLVVLRNGVFGFSFIDEYERDIGTDDNGELIAAWKQVNKYSKPFYRPKYYHLFDSYEIKQLPSLPYNPWTTTNKFVEKPDYSNYVSRRIQELLNTKNQLDALVAY